MKSSQLAAAFFLLSYVLLGGVIAVSYFYFPEPLATHFDFRGRPNGWMSREQNAAFLAGFSVFNTLLIFVVGYFSFGRGTIRFNWGRPRVYTVAPAYQAEVKLFFLRIGFYFAGLMQFFLIGCQIAILITNAGTHQPVLSPLVLAPALLLLLGGMVLLGRAAFRYVRDLMRQGVAVEKSAAS